MITRKKALLFVTTIILSLLLVACGGDGKSEQTANNGSISDNPRNYTAEDFMPISEGLEEYSVWIETEENPVRDSRIKNIYVFDKDEVTMYPIDGSYVIEDILEMSDDELIKLAQDTTNEFYNEMEEEVKDRKFFDLESFNETRLALQSMYEGDEELQQLLEAHYQEVPLMNEDISYAIEGEWSEQSNPYNLDIKIDDLGQYTEKIELTIPNAGFHLKKNSSASSFGSYIDLLFYNIDMILLKSESKELYEEQRDSLVSELQQQGKFEEKDGFDLTHPQSFVPEPFEWEAKDETINLQSVVVHQKIFETTFAGIKAGSGSLITRVDDSFVGFRLDDPDTNKENVTIEGQ